MLLPPTGSVKQRQDQRMPEAVSDVALRDIWFGRIWRAHAARLVEERDDLVVVWMPMGSEERLPVDQNGTRLRIPQPEWRLVRASRAARRSP